MGIISGDGQGSRATRGSRPVAALEPRGDRDSLGEAERHYADAVRRFIGAMKIRSAVELDCGDYRVGRRIARRNLEYVGFDADLSLLERNRQRYGGRHVRFVAGDVIGDDLPDGELCLAGEVLRRLTNAEIRLLLLKFKKFKYVIFNEYMPRLGEFTPNLDKPPGRLDRLDRGSALLLQHPPFNVRCVEYFLISPLDNHSDLRLCSFLIRMQDQATRLDPVYLD